MSRFLKICKVGFDFKSCVHILGKAGKMAIQANETLHKGLKYSVGSLSMLSHFVDYLQN